MGNCHCNNGDKGLHDLQPDQEPMAMGVPKEEQEQQSSTNRQLPAPMTQAVKAVSQRTNKERQNKNVVSVVQDSNNQGQNGIESRLMKDKLRHADTSQQLPNLNNNQQQQQEEVKVPPQQPAREQAFNYNPNIPMISPQYQQQVIQQAPVLIEQQLSPMRMEQELKRLQSQAIQTSKEEEEKKIAAKPADNPMSPIGGSAQQYIQSSGFGQGNTLFEKLGADEGIKILIDCVFDKVMADNNLSPFYSCPGMKLGMIKQKYRYYFSYLTGGVEHWIGQPISECHKHINISDAHFDQFNSYCIQTLKEMRKLKVDGLKEMIRILQTYRDNIVMKEEPVIEEDLPPQQQQQPDIVQPVVQEQPPQVIIPEVPKTLFQELGGIQTLKNIAQSLMQSVSYEPQLSHYFTYTDQESHQRKLAHYFAYLTGGYEEWIGKSMSSAHKMHFITENQFDLFVSHIQQALIKENIQEPFQQKFLTYVQSIKLEIVNQQVNTPNIYEQLSSNGLFLNLTNTFVELLQQDEVFSEYFAKNQMMGHIIYTIVNSFFSNQSQEIGLEKAKQIETFGMRLNEEQFTVSKKIFGQACIKCKVNPLLASQALEVYSKLETLMVVDEPEPLPVPVQVNLTPVINQVLNNQVSESIPPFEPIPQQEVQNDVSGHDADSDSVRGPEENAQALNIKRQQTSNLQKLEQQFKYESVSERDHEDDNNPVVQRRSSQQQSINLEQNPPTQSQNHLLHDESQPQLEGVSAIDNQDTQRRVELQLEQLIEVIEVQDARPSILQESPKKQSLPPSPMKVKKLEIEIKYNFYAFLGHPIIYEGELQRHVEKQKSKISRWIVLRREAILIYKDHINSKSYPERPLQCVPLGEIYQIRTREVFPEKQSKMIKKAQHPQHYEIELELNDQYGIIASKIGQLFTDYTLTVLGQTINQQHQLHNDSKVLNQGKYAYHPTKHQIHGFSDSILTFLSINKKEIQTWQTKIKAKQEVILHREKELAQEAAAAAKELQKRLEAEDAIRIPEFKPDDSFNLENKLRQVPNQLNRVSTYVDQIFERLKEKIIEASSNSNDESQALLLQELRETLTVVAEYIDTEDESLSRPERNKQDTVVHEIIDYSIENKIIYDRRQIERIHSYVSSLDFEQLLCKLSRPVKVPTSLYDRLGGEPAIQAVVDGMYQKIFNDPELQDFFRKTNKDHQKVMQKKFLTQATGGPSTYDGKSMADAHKGRGIRSKEFDKVALHVVTTLQELSVSEDLIGEVVALLLPLRQEVADDCKTDFKPPFMEEIKESSKEIEEDQQVEPPTVSAQPSLFDRLGGAPAIQALVDGMYAKIFTDPDLKDFFRKTDKEHQKMMQVQFLTYATGGPAEYKGRNMRDAHSGRGIRSFEFNKVATIVINTLAELGIADNLIQEVVSLLTPLQSQVVDTE